MARQFKIMSVRTHLVSDKNRLADKVRSSVATDMVNKVSQECRDIIDKRIFRLAGN